MKIKRKLFCKSFLLAFLVLSVLSAIIITSLYLNKNAIDPLHKESTILVGITDDNRVLSLCIIKFNPQNKTVTYLPIPDNVWTENGTVLQNQYNDRNISYLKSSIEELISTKINRYIMFSVDNLSEINNQMGYFTMNAQYSFEHKGELKAGTLHMDGELVSSMFLYSKYDMTKVSMSNIGFAYLKSFLATYGRPTYIEKLSDIISKRSFLRNTHTNISKKEMKAYCELLSQYTQMTVKTVELSGKYDTQPYSNIYFFPDTTEVNKNLLK